MAKTALAAALLAVAGCTARGGSDPPAQGLEPPAPTPEGAACVACHREATPAIVTDWESSAHARGEVDCATCHGTAHSSAEDAAEVAAITAETCAACHPDQFEQFARGKHSRAWQSMRAMPTVHWQPAELTGGLKGCGGCHKIGLKSKEEVEALRASGSGYGLASCDSCHTRHTFAKSEAREPEACATCHVGYDQPQWQMYRDSKHGVRHALRREGALPPAASAPACQDCHMEGGNHEVRTAWGYFGLRMNGMGRHPDDTLDWWEDRLTILTALGVLSPEGEATDRLETFETLQILRTSTEEFDRERQRMAAICARCHSPAFARAEFEKADGMVRESDRMLAEAIRIVAALYADGVLRQPADYRYPFPDLLTLLDAPTLIETRLSQMHLKHRMRAFKGAFHSSPDYALWHGWSELEADLSLITERARELRERHAAREEVGHAGDR